jgi:hypothetical protein
MSYNLLKEKFPSINKKLREKFDSDDPVIFGLRFGGVLRRNGGKRGGKVYPEWVFNPKAVRKLLLNSFPRLNEHSVSCTGKTKDALSCRCPFHQRRGAARWALIMYKFWHEGRTEGEIVVELNEGPEDSPATWHASKVRNIIRHIKDAAKGLRSNGRGKITGKRPGRPRLLRD